MLKYFKGENTGKDRNAGIKMFELIVFICSPRGNHQSDFKKT